MFGQDVVGAEAAPGSFRLVKIDDLLYVGQFFKERWYRKLDACLGGLSLEKSLFTVVKHLNVIHVRQKKKG